MNDMHPITNLEAAIAVLRRHREARKWNDEAVAHEMMAHLDVAPDGKAAKAPVMVDPNLVTEEDTVAAEEAAKVAVDKATAMRGEINKRARAEDDAKAEAAVAHAKAARDEDAAKAEAAEQAKRNMIAPWVNPQEKQMQAEREAAERQRTNPFAHEEMPAAAEQRRLEMSRELGMAPTATQAEIDAEVTRRHAAATAMVPPVV